MSQGCKFHLQGPMQLPDNWAVEFWPISVELRKISHGQTISPESMATEKNDETLESLKSCIRSQVALGAKAEKNIEKGGQTVTYADPSTHHWNNYCASFVVNFELWVGLRVLLLQECKLSFHLVSSVGRVPVCSWVGGRRFKPQPDHHSGS